VGDPGRIYSVPQGLEHVACYDAPAVAGVEGRAVMKTWVERVRG
jgi:predicted nicotinamide N-methyase